METEGTSEAEGAKEKREVGTAEAEAGRTDPTTMDEVELAAELEREGSSFPRGRWVLFHWVWTGRGADEVEFPTRVPFDEGRVEFPKDSSGSSSPWLEGTTPTTPPVATAEATALLGAW